MEGKEAGKVRPLSRRRLEVSRPVCTDSVPADFLEHAFLSEVPAPSTLSPQQLSGRRETVWKELILICKERGRKSKAFF